MLTDRHWKLDALLRLLTLGCLGLVLTLLVLMATQPAIQQRLSPANYEFFKQAGGLLPAQILGLILLARFLREHDVTMTEAFGLRLAPLRTMGGAVLTMIILFPIVILLMNLVAMLMQKFFGIVPSEQPTVEFLKHHPPLWQTALLGLAAVGMAPIAEEMLFRGVLYPFLKQRGFPRLALWGTATLFGCIHFNLGALIPLICLGLVWTWLYERTRNLLAPITAHVLFNAVNFIALTADLPDWVEKLIKK